MEEPLVINLSEDDRFGICAVIIEQEIADYPEEVKDAVFLYALGNLGAAHLLSEAVKEKSLDTKYKVDRFVELIGVTGSNLHLFLKNEKKVRIA